MVAVGVDCTADGLTVHGDRQQRPIHSVATVVQVAAVVVVGVSSVRARLPFGFSAGRGRGRGGTPGLLGQPGADGRVDRGRIDTAVRTRHNVVFDGHRGAGLR